MGEGVGGGDGGGGGGGGMGEGVARLARQAWRGSQVGRVRTRTEALVVPPHALLGIVRAKTWS